MYGNRREDDADDVDADADSSDGEHSAGMRAGGCGSSADAAEPPPDTRAGHDSAGPLQRQWHSLPASHSAPYLTGLMGVANG